MARILLVEDELSIQRLLREYLERNRHQVRTERSGERALEGWTASDLLIVDLGLPGMSGFELVRSVRSSDGDFPIMVISGRHHESSVLAAFDLGVDDYVVKPCSPREVAARVRALLRRAAGSESWRFGALHIRPDRREAFVDGRELRLTRLEFDLLLALARHPGVVFTRTRLLETVWGPAFPGIDRVVDVRISALRKALGDDPASPRWIETVHGVGYRFLEGT